MTGPGVAVARLAGAQGGPLSAALGSTMETSLVIGVGDGKLGKFPTEYLVTFALGSCIAVMCYDWKLKIGGLVHIMLPDSSIDKEKAARNPYVFADTGIPAMFKKLCEAGSSPRSIRSCIAGGAKMLEHSSHFEIGKKNHLAVKRAFWQLGAFIDREDVGGAESRSVRLDLRTGQVDLRVGGEENQILMGPGRHS